MTTKKSLGIALMALAIAGVLALACYGALHMASGRGGTSNADAIALDSSLTVGTTLSVTATSTFGSQGTPVYWTMGGVDYGAVEKTFTATSSIPAIMFNPFGNATTTIDSVICQVTGGTLVAAQTFDISTTSSATGYGSSTPALVYGRSLAAGATDTVIWQPTLVASTSLSVSNSLFTTGRTGVVPDGSSPFMLGPTHAVTLRIATSSAGTFSSYLSGTCLLVVRKP